MSERMPARGGLDGPRKRSTSSTPQRRSAGGGGSAAQRGSSGTTKPSQPTRLPPEQERPAAQVDVHDPDGVRLQKLLAAAGVGSRRTCENLISSGRVTVDGHLVTELGVRINPDTQTVHVDGSRVQLDESRVYLAFNKPLGVVSTTSDELGRPCVGDFVSNRKERLFHVGRLDADTEGLLLLTNDREHTRRADCASLGGGGRGPPDRGVRLLCTNDGELAQRLQHPSYGVLKTYVAQIPGPVPRDLRDIDRKSTRLNSSH